jgi:hypothetical protein
LAAVAIAPPERALNILDFPELRDSPPRGTSVSRNIFVRAKAAGAVI